MGRHDMKMEDGRVGNGKIENGIVGKCKSGKWKMEEWEMEKWGKKKNFKNGRKHGVRKENPASPREWGENAFLSVCLFTLSICSKIRIANSSRIHPNFICVSASVTSYITLT